MCTATYIPLQNDKIILTSNRDERAARPTLHPAIYKSGANSLIYPKDEEAGGTWIAASDKGIICFLLNGAFKPHKRILPYIKSRGLVLLDSFNYSGDKQFYSEYLFNKIEPFTLVIIDYFKKSLSEIRWDGKRKYYKKLDYGKPYIWSSASLYSKQVIEARKKLFNIWITDNNNLNRNQLLNFHTFKHFSDIENDFIMQRGDFLKTVSITQVEIYNRMMEMYYNDLVNNKNSNNVSIQLNFNLYHD
jgi:uncharacterized protein with NRDE domain